MAEDKRITRGFQCEEWEWQKLDEKAKQLDCIAQKGHSAGKPSVNMMLRKIASGEVKVTRQ